MNECMEAKREIAEKFMPCAKAIAALGYEARMRIVLALLHAPERGLRVGAVAERVHMSRPSATHHLAILKEAGLVSVLKEGTKNFYYMDADPELWGRLAALFSEISETVRRADEEGYPFGSCAAAEKEQKV